MPRLSPLVGRLAIAVGFLVSQFALIGLGVIVVYRLYESRHTMTVSREAVPALFPVVVWC